MNRLLATILAYVPFGRKSPQTIKSGRTLTGYGRVNYWAECSESVLRKDLIECAANKVACYHIEFAGWANDYWTNDKTRNKYEERYCWLLKRCRALGLLLFVSVVNDNMGHGKYGDKGPLLEKVKDVAKKTIDFIEKQGKHNTLIQPVAEAQTNAGRDIENYAKQKLAGFSLVYNGNKGQPTSSSGMQFIAYHPSSIAKVKSVSSSSIISTDHGTIIKELGHGLDGEGKPDKLKELVSVCKSRGNPLCVYYAFKHQGHDKNAIKAMRP